MSTPTETYPLPASIPTVTVVGEYRGPDGRGLAGTVTFTGPSLLTFPDADLFIAGPVVAKLDEYGRFAVTLPATDAPGMSPADWAYVVKENLTGITGSRTFSMLLPADTPDRQVNLADVAPSDPLTPNYTPVVGPRGPAGADGVDGADGLVQSVNGYSVVNVVLNAADVGALALSARGAVNGVASLDATGKVPASQLPAMSSGTDSGTLNVRSYGATGDGVTDDAPAIQDALDAAYAAGGGWVVVPAGTYACATLPLRIYRNTRLTLVPGARFKRTAPNTFLLNGDAAQTFGGYTGHGNIIVEGGTWDMRATDFPTNPDMCISIGHARNVIIRDIELLDLAGYHGIELNSTKGAVVDGCSFRGYVDTGGRDFSEAVQIDLAGRPSLFGGFGPYDGTPCEDITMRDCYVGPSGTAGTVAWPSGVGSHSATWGKWHRRIRIEGNTFEGGAQNAVKPYIWEESTVSGNTIKDCGGGVWLRTLDSSKTADRTDMNGVDKNASQAGTTFVIADNVFRNITGFSEPVYVQGEATGKWYGLTITGNTVNTVGNSENGIRLFYAERYVVANNSITGPAGTGISQELVADGLVSGNRISGAGGSGISCVTTTDMMITDNMIWDATVNGVHVQGGSALRISGNVAKGVGKGGAGYGYRVTTGSDRLTLTNNTYRRVASNSTHAINAISITAGNTNVRRFGNDVLKQGANATGTGTDDVNDASTTPNLSALDSGA